MCNTGLLYTQLIDDLLNVCFVPIFRKNIHNFHKQLSENNSNHMSFSVYILTDSDYLTNPNTQVALRSEADGPSQ